MRLEIHADGASWGNPGPAAIGAVIKDEQRKELFKISQYIGRSTNNQAEYQAVIAALRAATRFKSGGVIIHLDSELIVRQLAGSYKVRSTLLRPLYAEAAELSKKFTNLSIVHIRHEENVKAHTLAKAALKKFLRQKT